MRTPRTSIRRFCLAVVTAVLVAAAVGSRPPAALAAPHIVVVMTDDLDVEIAETMLALGFLPNIKTNIVDRGVRFRESFVTTSLCCPSRATYLTGRYAHNHGVLRNNSPRGSVNSFVDTSTLATWLHAAGYHTAHVGKYLNGYAVNPSAPPTSPQNPTYIPPGWDDWYSLIGANTYRVYRYTMNQNGTVVQYGAADTDYQTSVLADLARGIVAKAIATPTTPLFLSVTPLTPHVELFTMVLSLLDGIAYPDVWTWYLRPDNRDATRKPAAWTYIFSTLLPPMGAPSFNEADVSDKPAGLQKPLMTSTDITNMTRQYRNGVASMLAVDDLVGVIVQALGAELANTVLIFTSDNGYLYGEHRLSGKAAIYDESLRVPLYVAGPGIAGGRTVDTLVVNNDWAPTIAQLGGAVPATPIDGRSLVDVLQGGGASDWRRRFLVEYLSSNFGDVPTYTGLRTGADDDYPLRTYAEYNEKLLAPTAVTDVDLYDLNVDPFQVDNLRADPTRAAERAALQATLAQLRTCGGTTAPSCQALER
jgi:N-acetylglucosamine-6-sulfatase